MKKLQTVILILILFSFSSYAQEVINLYQGTIPNSKGEIPEGQGFEGNPGMIRKVYNPSLEIYQPEQGKANGCAVVICPGGGYSMIVFQGEGVSTAKEFAKNGITAFVLKYRLPDESIEVDKTIAPIQDAQQAIKVVRENAAKWGVDPNKVGIVGFSAGGHLASAVATHYKNALIENANHTSLRPDFQILVYPVISMQADLTHADSRKQLLGENPTKEIVDLYSNELQVNEDTPPAYITHAGDDTTVDVDNSINYFEALRHHKVPAELHIYQKGNHGFVFRHPSWTVPLFEWLKESKFID